MVLALMIGGLCLAGVSLWQVGRLLQQAEAAPKRLDNLVDELVATAEATTATVADRAEALGALLAEADERIAALQALAGGAPPAVTKPSQIAPTVTETTAPVPQLPPSLVEAVRSRLSAGQDEATIARELGLARTAVRLAAKAAKSGGER